MELANVEQPVICFQSFMHYNSSYAIFFSVGEILDDKQSGQRIFTSMLTNFDDSVDANYYYHDRLLWTAAARKEFLRCWGAREQHSRTGIMRRSGLPIHIFAWVASMSH